jgi:hypothetical protein
VNGNVVLQVTLGVESLITLSTSEIPFSCMITFMEVEQLFKWEGTITLDALEHTGCTSHRDIIFF